MDIWSKIISYFLAALYSVMSAFGGMIPRTDGKDLRVTAYFVADNAAMAEKMDPSHLKDVTDLVLIGALAGFGEDGHVKLNAEFDGIIAAVREKTQGTDIRLHRFSLCKGTNIRGTFQPQVSAEQQDSEYQSNHKIQHFLLLRAGAALQ